MDGSIATAHKGKDAMSTEAVTQGPVRAIDGSARLIGSRCTQCGSTAFPAQSHCARCEGGMSETPLPTEGTVWSWTVQRIAVKPPYAGPQPFEPFVVAYIDLGPLKVESPLFGRSVDGWSIGDAVSLCTGDAQPHLAYWFEGVAR